MATASLDSIANFWSDATFATFTYFYLLIAQILFSTYYNLNIGAAAHVCKPRAKLVHRLTGFGFSPRPKWWGTWCPLWVHKVALVSHTRVRSSAIGNLSLTLVVVEGLRHIRWWRNNLRTVCGEFFRRWTKVARIWNTFLKRIDDDIAKR